MSRTQREQLQIRCHLGQYCTKILEKETSQYFSFFLVFSYVNLNTLNVDFICY